jgi:putative heme-binding domain-containing protein
MHSTAAGRAGRPRAAAAPRGGADRDAIRRTIMRNLSVPAALIIAPGVSGHTEALDQPAPVNLDAAKKPGDAKRGQQIFATICITCHKHGTMGVDVGPPLSDVKVKPPEGLLSDILDPNRMFEARWSAYAVETKDGRTLSGLIQNETSDAIVLALMGGANEALSRSAIKDMKSLDRTLMPDGLEAAISKEQMSDLLAFLLGK